MTFWKKRELADTYLSIRQHMKIRLYQPTGLTSVPAAWDIVFDPDATQQFTEFLSTNDDVAGWRINYRSTEVRD